MTKILNKGLNKGTVLKSGLIALTPAMTMTGSNTVFAADEPSGHGITSNDRVKIDEGVNVSGNLSQSASGGSAFTLLLNKMRIWVLAFLGFGVLAMLASFTLHALELALSAGNPQKRPQHVQSMGIDFAVMAFLGALSWIAGIAYNTI